MSTISNTQKITPCLWFANQAEEAANFYVSVFSGRNGATIKSGIKKITHYGQAGQDVHGQRPGSVMTVAFELDGQEFTGLNGGPQFKFTEAISLQVFCKDQKEIDYFWEKLSAGGGEEGPCGWLKDKFGLSWQVVPEILPKLLEDPKKSERVVAKFMKMKKMKVKELEEA